MIFRVQMLTNEEILKMKTNRHFIYVNKKRERQCRFIGTLAGKDDRLLHHGDVTGRKDKGLRVRQRIKMLDWVKQRISEQKGKIWQRERERERQEEEAMIN